MRDVNGVCKKVVIRREGMIPLVRRIHRLTKKTDVSGRVFSSCDDCGFVEIFYLHLTIKQ